MHLGDYIFWDDERQMEFIRDHYGWKETEIEGTTKDIKSAECIMPGMHDFTNYLKRIRKVNISGKCRCKKRIIVKGRGFELSKKYDMEIPGITGLLS